LLSFTSSRRREAEEVENETKQNSNWHKNVKNVVDISRLVCENTFSFLLRKKD